MANFFRDGGVGMYPTLIFGFLLIASAVLYLLRPERRYVSLVVSLGAAMLGSGFLNFSLGLMATFRYLKGVPVEQRFTVAGLGFVESLNNVVLALMLLVLAALIASIGAFRIARGGASDSATP